MKKHLLTAVLTLGAATLADAAIISINFSENSANQGFAGGANIGPLATNSSFWNTTNGQPNLAAGTLSSLIDDSGAITGASMTWASSNPWYNNDGVGSDEARLSVGYLDDGGPGVQITVSNIPFAEYVVLGLLASDQSGQPNTYTTLDFTVNGSPILGGTASAYKGINESFAAEGANWTPLTTSNVGNYWTSPTETSSTLTITAPPRSGTDRGSISGIIIQQVPEPGSIVSLALGGALLGFARRRRS